MALWGFSRESTQLASGANTVAGRVKGYQAPFVAGKSTEMVQKRNIIATKNGWVRREIRVMPVSVENTTRIIDQEVVDANPGYGFDYTANTYLGNPDIAQIYVKLNANGFVSANVSANLYVVFNTPISIKASGNALSITISNTAAGNSGVARFLNTGSIVNANNTLVFKMPKLQGNTHTGNSTTMTATYKIGAQTITVTGNPLYNPDDGAVAGAFANLVITGAVSNNLLDTIGNRITTFRVRAGG
jgi:hypothetical protein